MSKELWEMTKDELWELFPIFLVEPNKKWIDYYTKIESHLSKVLSSFNVHRISHIGSTAISGIWAKNIVDVMIEFSKDTKLESVIDVLTQDGFYLMFNDSNRAALNKGYTKEGFAEEVYHIHLRLTGDNDELYFRDYLNEHPEIAKEYETLKLGLWKIYEHNRDAYTESKTDFIRKYTAHARELYGDRYL